MKNSHVVSKKDLERAASKLENRTESAILAISDLNDHKTHYGIIGEVDNTVSIPAHTLLVKTKNGVKKSRIFDDKLEDEGLSEGDEFLGTFVIKNNRYANIHTIEKK
jgi:hypothetical protein